MKMLHIDISNASVAAYALDGAYNEVTLSFSGIPESWETKLVYATFIQDDLNPTLQVVDGTVKVPSEILVNNTDFYVGLYAMTEGETQIEEPTTPVLVVVSATESSEIDVEQLVKTIMRLNITVEGLASEGYVDNIVEDLAYYGDATIKPTDASYFTFALDDTTMTATISHNQDTDGIDDELVIPHHYTVDGKTYAVTTIGRSGFRNYPGQVTSVIIPNTVTTIQTQAFENNTSIKSIKLPDSIINIYDSAFYGLSNLTEITLPKNLEIIDSEAFRGCGLKEVIIPEGVASIGSYAFAYCESLERIVIPKSATNIQSQMFQRDSEDVLTIYYEGTMEQWHNLSDMDPWVLEGAQTNLVFSNFEEKVDKAILITKTRKAYGKEIITDKIAFGTEIKITITDATPGKYYCVDYDFGDCYKECTINDEGVGTIIIGEFTNPVEWAYGGLYISNIGFLLGSNDDNGDYYEATEQAFTIEYTCYQDVSDLLKEHETNIKNLNPTPIKTIPDILEANQKYNFGEITELNLAFPTTASDGDVIYLTFSSGTTATTLTIDTTNTCDIEVIPETNTGYEIFGMYNGSIWIINYSEYTVSEV